MKNYCSLHSISKLFILGMFLFTSCVGDGGGLSSKRKSNSGTTADDQQASGGSDNSGNNAGPGDGSVGTITDEILVNGRSELRHIIDPFSGTYKTKVTIPKNYKGFLYLSGLNISGLNDKLISVRFRFGREREEIVIPATVGRAPGIIPQTDVEVLILDLEDQPFQDMRLLYDLYDYNDYDTNDDGTEFSNGDDSTEPTNDVRDSGLFCRGLRLEDDPTFTISSTNDKCDSAGETCLYAYAKVKDSGLYYLDNASLTAINPSEPQIDISNTGYANQTQTELIKKCLPDVDHRSSVENVLQSTTSSSSTTKVAYGDTAYNNTYTYLGPYRSLNRSFWEISGEAVFSDMSANGTEPSGLFQAALNNSPINTVGDPNGKSQGGQKSFLFPRSGKINLKPNLEYIGFTDLTDQLSAVRSIRSLVSAGDSEFVDGCNLRVSNYDDFTNEGISSCNISATIDLVYTDIDTGEVKTLNASKDIKLQLTRASQTDFEGNEVRYSALKKCSNSNACGSNECCFNERCWSKTLVSQCLEDQPGEGNLNTGESCASDFQCSSLCCSSASSTCGIHNPGEDNFCSKSPGQQCVTKEFCRKENISTCFIVKTGFNSQGQQTCTRRCYNVPTFGECTAGVCVPPQAPDVPTFDPNNPDCSQAQDPPTNL